LNRRNFLRGVAGLAIMRTSQGYGAVPSMGAIVAVDDAQFGRAIPDDFTGLSYESAVLGSPDYLSPANLSMLRLIHGLGSKGVLRLGGNSSEATIWRGPSEGNKRGDILITSTAINNLVGLLEALDWRLIYGLNLARGSAAAAADEAAYVAQAAGRRLLAFEVGNEPDGFGSWRGVRPRPYDVNAFVAEWKRFRAAIVARVPDARFAGPAIANQQEWIRPFADAAGDSLALVTRHYYADGPAFAPHVNLTRLMTSESNLEPILAELRSISDRYGIPFRIEETNSIYLEGQPGVSDVFASALWGLELMFRVAEAGGVGVNFHAGDSKAYTPIGPREGGRHTARPLYYGMLMFKEATQKAALVPARLAAPDQDVVAYATRFADGTLNVCLINKDLEHEAQVRIETRRNFASASLLRLTAPSAGAKNDITLGGSAVDDFGRWSPRQIETLRWRRNSVVAVPAASAVMVKLSGRGLS
jgi:hypothetical protein